MRWPRPWRHRDHEAHERADEALRESSARRAETERRDRTFLPKADRIRQMRERNHLAEAIEAALREGGR